MLMEICTGEFINVARRELEQASRSELIEFLESRGCACFDEESTELLRECALDDWDCEYGGTSQ